MPKPACSHLNQIGAVTPGSEGCAECLAKGDTWVHLRLCLTCGHVGCCDSSKNKHATKHFQATGHPIMRLLTSPLKPWQVSGLVHGLVCELFHIIRVKKFTEYLIVDY